MKTYFFIGFWIMLYLIRESVENPNIKLSFYETTIAGVTCMIIWPVVICKTLDDIHDAVHEKE